MNLFVILSSLIVASSSLVRGDHSTSAYQDTYSQWQNLVDKRQITTDSIHAIDISINQVLNDLPDQVKNLLSNLY